MKHYKKRLISILLSISVLINGFYFNSLISEAKETEEPPKPVVIVVYEESEKIEEPEITEEIVGPEPVEEVVVEPEIIEEPEPLTTPHTYDRYLTKRGGVYHNPYTGLKETWYSQRVLPGGGLDIPGRHVNEEGFVCDADGYICVASSTYPKGTVIETSRGMGKVYDSGCAPGILDIYTNW